MTWQRPVRPSVGLTLAAILAAAPAATEVALPARDAVLLMAGQEGGTLPMEATVQLGLPVDGQPPVRVTVEVPAWSLLELAGSEPLPLLLAVYAVGADGALQGSAAEGHRVAPAGLVAAGASGVRLSVPMALPAGELSLRVLLKAGSEFGLRVLNFEAPALEGGPEWMAIELPTEGDELMDQLSRKVEDEAALKLIREYIEAGVLVQGGGRWVLPPESEGGTPPAPALPVVASADRLEVELLARGRPVREPVIELVPGGPPLPESELDPVQLELKDFERLGGGAGGWNRFRAKIELPALGEGRFRLRFQPPATGRSQEMIVTRSETETLTWAEMIRSEGAGPEPIQGGTERARPSAAVRHLEQALEQFAAAGASDLAPLEELFLDEWRRAGVAGAAALVEAGNRLAWDLVAEEPEALVPLAAASAQLYRRFLDRQQYGLSTSARRLTVILLDIYTRGGNERNPTYDRAETAAIGWASFAGELVESGLQGRAAALYKRALESDPKQRESLYLLAAIYERNGHYDQAASSYRRLVELAPRDPELQLRLAVQERRIGQQNAAERRLSELLAKGAPGWVSVVAAQELARMYLDSGRTDAAVEVLDSALERHPRDEKLILFRAAVGELTGAGGTGTATLAGLDPEPAAREPSARHRYADWPPPTLGDARVRLAAAAEERRPALIQAFGGQGRRR